MKANRLTVNDSAPIHLSDERLFSLYLNGSHAALEALCRRYRNRLTTRLRVRFGIDEVDAEEAADDAWPEILKLHDQLTKTKAALRQVLGIRRAA